MIKAPDAGAGKSHLCFTYAIHFELKFCVVVPDNRKIDEVTKKINELKGNKNIIFDVMTFHHFFNMDICGNKLHYKIDYNKYELIIFEEIYSINSILLNKVNKFKEKYENIQLIANGDIYQLPPIEEKLSDNKKNEMINYLFNNQIILKISKRFKKDYRFKQIKNLKKKFINANTEEERYNQRECIKYIVNEIFKNQCISNINEFIEQNEIYNAITYTNDSRHYINNLIHKKVMNKNNNNKYYYNGLKLICKKRIKTNEMKFNINQEYSITNIDNKNIYIENKKFKKETINNNFTLNYAYTCHTAQGASINDKYIICDWQNEYADLRWLYTAITRATNFDNIYFYTDNVKTEKFIIRQHINKMIRQYIYQDKKAGREI